MIFFHEDCCSRFSVYFLVFVCSFVYFSILFGVNLWNQFLLQKSLSVLYYSIFIFQFSESNYLHSLVASHSMIRQTQVFKHLKLKRLPLHERVGDQIEAVFKSKNWVSDFSLAYVPTLCSISSKSFIFMFFYSSFPASKTRCITSLSPGLVLELKV